MPTSKPTEEVEEITLYPFNKKSGKKRSRDEMSMSSEEEEYEDVDKVEGTAVDSTSRPPQEPVRRSSSISGNPAPQKAQRRSIEKTETHVHPRLSADMAESHEGPRRTHVEFAGGAGVGQGHVPGLPVLPAMHQPAAHGWYPPYPEAVEPGKDIQGIRNQIIDNIQVLAPHVIKPEYQRMLYEARHTENTAAIHIVTFKRNHEWTAAWTFGHNYIILRSRGSATVTGALENLLETTSDILLRVLKDAGRMEGLGD